MRLACNSGSLLYSSLFALGRIFDLTDWSISSISGRIRKAENCFLNNPFTNKNYKTVIIAQEKNTVKNLDSNIEF